jgi:hypothetical protein
MTDAEIYLQAAEDVAVGISRYSCLAARDVAITDSFAMSGLEDAERVFSAYGNLFAPQLSKLNTLWGVKWGRTEAERRECRVLALCLMAAIAESEE